MSPCSELQWFFERKTDSELSFPGASVISKQLSITQTCTSIMLQLQQHYSISVRCKTDRTGKDLIAAKVINPIRNTNFWNQISALKTEPSEFSAERTILWSVILHGDPTDLCNTLTKLWAKQVLLNILIFNNLTKKVRRQSVHIRIASASAVGETICLMCSKLYVLFRH